MRTAYTTIVLDRIEANQQTPIWWPLRIWLGGEILFAFAASRATFVFPQNAATNFAWPISLAVMAAVLGVFYAASAPVTIWAYRMKYWQEVRVLVVPLGVFAFCMSLMTFLHWSQFSFGTPGFAIQLARFQEQVQWPNIPLWILLLDSAAVAVLILYLWVTRASRARSVDDRR